MPIKRLQRDVPAQFPCIGKLRKGGPKRKAKNGREIFGEDLNHFRFTTEDKRAAEMFEHVYGDEPDTIHCYLPYPTTDENFSAWQEAWTGGGLTHRCDGETCSIWYDKGAGTYKTDPIPCPGGCKEVGRLMIIIPALERFAYVSVETHSVWDIVTLTENLRAVELLRGSLTSIPFVLKRRPKVIGTPGQDGQRVLREKWLLSIEVDPEWASRQLDYMHRQALRAAAGKTLPAPRAVLELNGEMAQEMQYAGELIEALEEGEYELDLPPGEPIDEHDTAFLASLPDGFFDDVEEDEAAEIAMIAQKPRNFWDEWDTVDMAYSYGVKQGAFEDENKARAAFAQAIRVGGNGVMNDDTLPAIYATWVKQVADHVAARKNDLLKLMHGMGNVVSDDWHAEGRELCAAHKVDSTTHLDLGTVQTKIDDLNRRLRMATAEALSVTDDPATALLEATANGRRKGWKKLNDVPDGWPLYHAFKKLRESVPA